MTADLTPDAKAMAADIACPACAVAMTRLQLTGHSGTAVAIDMCAGCHVFWFDRHESLRLSPASTLELFAVIGERMASLATALRNPLRCPRCRTQLEITHDRQRSTTFKYYRCDKGHGRLSTFFNFLREKDFVRPLTPAQLAELRGSLHSINCSNCGAPIDLARRSDCDQCGSPISMLDMKQAGTLVAQLRAAADPRPIDPALPLELERARRDVDAMFAAVPSSDLVEAGLAAIARWFRNRAS